MCSLPPAHPKGKEERSSITSSSCTNTAPPARFTLRRKHFNSSSWLARPITCEQISAVTNYRNDPWKYSLNLELRGSHRRQKLTRFHLQSETVKQAQLMEMYSNVSLINNIYKQPPFQMCFFLLHSKHRYSMWLKNGSFEFTYSISAANISHANQEAGALPVM